MKFWNIIKSDYQQQLTIAFAVVFCALLGVFVSRFDGVLVLAAVVSMGMFVVMFLNPQFTTLSVLFVLYANLTVVATRFHGIPQFVAGGFFLLLALPFCYFLFIERKPVVFNFVLLLMFGYLIAMIISALFSRGFEHSADRIITYFLAGIILYFLIINTIRTKELLRKAVWVLIFSGVFMGSISIYQEVTRSYDNALGGLAQVKDQQISTGEVDLSGEKIKRRRLAGPIGSKNRYAQILVVLLPLALFRFWGENSRSLRIVAAASCFPILAGILLTFSRGAGVSIVFILILMMFLKFIKVRHFLLASVFCLGVMFVVAPHYLNRIYLTYTGLTSVLTGKVHEADGAVRGRTTVTIAAIKAFFDHPFLGVGPGQTSSYIPDYASRIGYRQLSGTRRAHNMYVEELSDSGLLGGILFFTIILVTLYKLNQTRRFLKEKKDNGEYIITGILLGIVAYLLTAIFLHLSYVRYFWFLLALAGAAIHIYKRIHQETDDEPPVVKIEVENVETKKAALAISN